MGIGLAYLAAAGAPPAYLLLNLAALGLGVTILSLTVRIPPPARGAGLGTLGLALVLLATSIFGTSIEGAARWFVLGPLFVQSSLLLLPWMILRFARTPNLPSTIAMVVAALALALQPDRAMAGALLAGLVARALFRFNRAVAVALASAALAFLVTMLRPDTLPAVPYVDQILFSAFEVHPLAGAAMWVGAVLLVTPTIAGRRGRPRERRLAFVFGSVWSAILVAAALGNYPTPLVGYGGSAILGYFLCLSALPGSVALAPQTEQSRAESKKRPALGGLFRWQSLPALGLIIFGMGNAAGQEAPQDCSRAHVEKVERPDTVWQPGPAGRQIPLWPEEVTLQLPDYDGHSEMTGNGSPLVAGRLWNWATYISRPTMTVYAPKGMNTGAAVLVMPGGGYAAVAMDLEGTEICDWVTELGVTCAVLKYRTPQVWRRGENGVGLPPDDLLALEDAQRAVSLLRDRADSYGIHPQKIGGIGFSAGAHLAAALSNAGERAYDAVDAADESSWQLDFAIVMYPGRFLTTRHPGTDLSLAPWMHISTNAPPTLLIHAMNDPVNDVRHSVAYGLALDEVGVPVDMRFFAKGCHAFGRRPTSDPITTEWPEHAAQWLQS
ncbi:MAG: alpha/beta hydrolase, partial [Acidobacteriota bacterium]